MFSFRPAWTEVVNEQITQSMDKVTDMNIFYDEPEPPQPEQSDKKEGAEAEKVDGEEKEAAEGSKDEETGEEMLPLPY